MLSYLFSKSENNDYLKYNSCILIQSVYRGYRDRQYIKKIRIIEKFDKLVRNVLFKNFIYKLNEEKIHLDYLKFRNDNLNERVNRKINKKNYDKLYAKPYDKINKHKYKTKKRMFKNIVAMKDLKMNNIFEAKYNQQNRYRKNLLINVSSPVLKNENYEEEFNIEEHLPCIDMYSPLCTPYYGSFMNTDRYRKQFKSYLNNNNRSYVIEKNEIKPFTCIYSIREGLKGVGSGIVKLFNCLTDMINIEKEMECLEEETERLLDDKFHKAERRRIKYKTI